MINLSIIVDFFQDSQEYFDVLLTYIKLLFSSLLFILDSFELPLNLDELILLIFRKFLYYNINFAFWFYFGLCI
jgi:hypothetical protein